MNHKDLIQKWLSDELNEKESNAFNALENANFYKKIIDDASLFKASNNSEMPTYENFKSKINTDKSPVKKINWLKPMLKIASVLVLFIGVYFVFFSNDLTEVETTVVEKTTVILPDNSRVVLNALSDIKYDETNWNNKREILLSGEAYFDVAKGSKFNVITSIGTVTVLGTEFNVKERGEIFEVTCFEGTVRVQTSNSTKILKIGDKFSSIKKEIKTKRHSKPSPAWIENTSQFDRIPVYEVIAELERQYGIDIETNKINTTQLFTGAFIHNNLESALMSISEPLGLNYEILKQNKVRLDISE